MNMKIDQVAHFLITGNMQVLLIFTGWFTPNKTLCMDWVWSGKHFFAELFVFICLFVCFPQQGKSSQHSKASGQHNSQGW